MVDLTYIKNKLLNYGITLENFEFQTGNLVGKTNVPSALRSFNKNLTSEQAFYLVANKVFELANILAYGIPIRIQTDFKTVVGDDIFRDFQKAIYEEINQRFVSNAFPEFENSGFSQLTGFSGTPSLAGGPSLLSWINPISKQIIANIDWLNFSDTAENLKYKVFMYKNMENASFPVSQQKKIVQVLEDGTADLEDKNYFATDVDLKKVNKKLEKTTNNQVDNTSQINIIKNQLPNLATIEYVNQIATSFPKIKKWNSDEIFNMPSFVFYNNKIYFCLKNHNLGHVPGGVSGQGWWDEITNIYTPPTPTNIVYRAGTDVKQAFVNPNERFYIDIQLLLNLNSAFNENSVFNLLNQKFPHLYLTKSQTIAFLEALCEKNFDILKKIYSKKIIYYKGQILMFNTFDDYSLFLDEMRKIYGSAFDSYIFTLPNDRYFLNSSENYYDNDLGGSSYIEKKNLPNEWYTFKTYDYYHSGRYKFGMRWNELERSNIDIFLEKDVSGWDISTGWDPKSTTKILKWVLKLNGGVRQREFWPRWKKVFSIRFIKNLFEEKPKYYVNICDLSIAGEIKNVNK